MPLQDEAASLRERIACLEAELEQCRARQTNGPSLDGETPNDGSFDKCLLPSHPLLLLTDTALPLGSFAFSSGLESFLAHGNSRSNEQPGRFYHFVHMSILSLASTTLPYLIAVYKSPAKIAELDDELDACLLCPVARRASISQGRALVSIWERSLRMETPSGMVKDAIQGFCRALRTSASNAKGETESHAHFPLIYSLVCNAQSLSLHETAYTYLFNHAKAVASAAVRASVLGPYASQALLNSNWVRVEIENAVKQEWTTQVQDAGQTVPAMDIWIGRHELLYSRIFNS